MLGLLILFELLHLLTVKTFRTALPVSLGADTMGEAKRRKAQGRLDDFAHHHAERRRPAPGWPPFAAETFGLARFALWVGS